MRHFRLRGGPARSALGRALGAALSGFRRAESGVAAVEFAAILPVMIGLLVGMGAVTAGFNRDRKLVILTRSIADLASRYTTLTTSNMSDIFAASTAVLQPYSDSIASVKMSLTSVKVTQIVGTQNYTGTVLWSCGQGMTARAVGSSVTVPSGFTSGASFLLAETTMVYNPPIGTWITGGAVTLAKTATWPVRNADYVTFSGSCP